MFLLVSFIGVCVFNIIPLIITLLDSFRPAYGENWFDLTSFRLVMENKAFQLAMKNTVIFTIVNIVLVLLLSLGLARILASKAPGKTIGIIFSIPMIIPTVSVAALLKLLFEQRGLLNKMLVPSGITNINWLDSDWAVIILAIMFLWKNLGFTMLIWVLSIQNVNESIKDAAMVDGANNNDIFKHIIFPDLKNALLLNLTILIINVFKIFREAYLIGGEYPHESIYMLQHIFNNWFRENEYTKIACGGVLYLLLIGSSILLIKSITFLVERSRKL